MSNAIDQNSPATFTDQESPDVPVDIDHQADAKSTRARALRAIWPYVRPYKLRLAGAISMLLLAAAASLALPAGVRLVIDQGMSQATGSFDAAGGGSLDAAFGLLFAAAALMAVFSAARYYLVLSLGERVVADVRERLFAHAMTLDLNFFERTRSGEVLSRLTADTTLVQSSAGVNLSIALRSSVLFVGGMVLMFVTSPWLTSVILLVIPLVILPVMFVGRRVRRLSRATQDSIAQANATAAEVLSEMPTVQAFTLQDRVLGHFRSAIEQSFDMAMRRIRMRALLILCGVLLAFGGVSFTLWLGARSVIAGEMSAGELGQFMLYAVMVSTSVAGLSEMWGELQRAAGALERIAELLATVPAIATPASPKQLAPPKGADKGSEIQLQAVSFEYQSRSGQKILSAVDLEIKPGETVALVGPSGAGKSTIFQLLLRFYDVHSGSVRIDGIDVRDVDPDALRSRIAYVPQEIAIFGQSLYENIALGRVGASKADVLCAAEAAGVESFASELPQQYATELGERGIRLSGGQRQRVAIARAILKDAPVLLLDEATAALDAQSEHFVQRALQDLRGSRTTLIIAHRLATVLSADRIVLLEAGRILDVGNHRELMARSELYKTLAELQFKNLSAS